MSGAPVQVAPAGWQLVPVEPTIGMLQSALEASRAAGYSTTPMCHEMHWAGLCWSAMLGNPDALAAPTQTGAAADDARDAARYRWLREQGALAESSRHPHSWRCVAHLADLGGEHADAAIDAAMSASTSATKPAKTIDGAAS